MSVGSLAHHGLGSSLRSGRRATGTGALAAPALVAVAGLVGVAAALRFYGIGHQGFWFDEANTAQLVRFTPGKMIGLIPQSESTPPLYYCVAWVWARLWGDSEAGLRSLSAVAVVPEAAWLLAEHRRRPPVQVAVAVVAACGLALIPLAISQNGTGHDRWIASAPLGLRLRQIVPQFLIGTGAPARAVLRDAAIALVAVALLRLALAERPAPRAGALMAGGLALAGFVFSLVLTAVGFDELITRNIIALWLPAALLVAGGLARGRGRGRTLGVAVAAALCAIGTTAAIGVAADRDLQRPDWRAVARILEPPATSLRRECSAAMPSGAFAPCGPATCSSSRSSSSPRAGRSP